MALKTAYEQIVDVTNIGNPINTRNQNELLKLANQERLKPVNQNPDSILVLGIDMQNDFMQNGSLAVPNSYGDVERFTRWIYNNLDRIRKIIVSMDCHQPFQIFHPCWWVDVNGNNPDPFTIITIDDLDNGKWIPVIDPIGSREYVQGLKNKAKKDLCIWTYHCLNGTFGQAIENQLTNMIYFHSVAKKAVVRTIPKGQDPYSEMYGIFTPEYSAKGKINLSTFNLFVDDKGNPVYDKIVIAGEAKDFCVYESIRQLLEFSKGNQNLLDNVYILEDCMSSVIDTKEESDKKYNDFKRKYGVKIVNSQSFVL